MQHGLQGLEGQRGFGSFWESDCLVNAATGCPPRFIF